MNQLEQTVFVVLSIAIIVALIIGYARLKHREFKRSRQTKKRFKRGSELEVLAKPFLESKGFRISKMQSPFYHNYKVNGKLCSSKLIVDYIAERKGKKYIIEVKSGKSAISITNNNSRRQLLEYDFVIDSDGVVLLDMENEQFNFIEFQSKKEKRDYFKIKKLLVIASLGIILPFWILKISVLLLFIFVWNYPRRGAKLFEYFHNSGSRF